MLADHDEPPTLVGRIGNIVYHKIFIQDHPHFPRLCRLPSIKLTREKELERSASTEKSLSGVLRFINSQMEVTINPAVELAMAMDDGPSNSGKEDPSCTYSPSVQKRSWRKKTLSILPVAGISLVIWGVLAIPIIVYHLPEVCCMCLAVYVCTDVAQYKYMKLGFSPVVRVRQPGHIAVLSPNQIFFACVHTPCGLVKKQGLHGHIHQQNRGRIIYTSVSVCCCINQIAQGSKLGLCIITDSQPACKFLSIKD